MRSAAVRARSGRSELPNLGEIGLDDLARLVGDRRPPVAEELCDDRERRVGYGVTVVTSHTVGNFPGSPVDLRYFFRLERGKIAALKVAP